MSKTGSWLLVFAVSAAILLPVPAVMAAEPCCNIAAIDAKNGVVTAKETATGRSFQFKVGGARTIASLKVGQAVEADFKTGKVTVRPAGLGPVNGVIVKAAEPAAALRKFAQDPCCNVTAIDGATGVVTARDNASGRTVRFQAAAGIRGSLRVGHQVWANFGTQQVSVDGSQPCCSMR